MNHSVILETRLAGKPVKVNLDYLNERIKVTSYHRKNINLLADYLNDLVSQNKFGKVIVVAQEVDWQEFIAHGYILEGVNSGYYLGRPGIYLAKFLRKERKTSAFLIEEDNILQDIIQHPVDPLSAPLPAEYVLRDAAPEDLHQMVLLYRKIFFSYPSLITEPDYLYQLIYKKLFKVILYGDKIISAASAEIDRENLTAELNDYACLPEYRRQGLMSRLIYALEQELIRYGCKNLYSIARARSPGINTVFWKLGYTYGGRLINNCTICGKFENMNLWTKNINLQ